MLYISDFYSSFYIISNQGISDENIVYVFDPVKDAIAYNESINLSQSQGGGTDPQGGVVLKSLILD